MRYPWHKWHKEITHIIKTLMIRESITATTTLYGSLSMVRSNTQKGSCIMDSDGKGNTATSTQYCSLSMETAAAFTENGYLLRDTTPYLNLRAILLDVSIKLFVILWDRVVSGINSDTYQ